KLRPEEFGGIGRVERRAFRVGLRQQPRSVGAMDQLDRGRGEDVVVDGVLRRAAAHLVYAPAKLLGAQLSVHVPLVEPRGLQRVLRDTSDEVERLRDAEGHEAGLRLRATIWIPRRV